MKYILIDTNIFVQDFWMEGNLFSILLNNHNVVAEQIAIPKIVHDEVLSQHDKKIADSVIKTEGSIRKISSYIGKIIDLQQQIETISQENPYPAFFDNFISKYNIKELEYPEVAHQVIAHKAMKRKKPFKENGEGYCDALIWNNILDLLQDKECEELFFITNNSKDFFHSGRLSNELQDELETLGIDKAKLHTYSELKSFVDEHIIPALENINNIVEKINNNDFDGFDLEGWIEGILFEHIEPKDAALAISNLHSDDYDLHLSEIIAVESIKAEDARSINKTSSYIKLRATIDLGIEICADWNQYQRSDEVGRLFDEAKVGIPTPYDCVYNSGKIEVEFSLIVENDNIVNSIIQIIAITPA